MKIFGNKKIVYIIYIGIALIAIISNLITPKNENIEEKHINHSISTLGVSNVNFEKKYCGIITRKFNDRKNHNYKTIEIKLSSSSYFYLRPYPDDRTGFYSYIQNGDSIFKDDWGFTFTIKRKNTTTTFIINPDYIDN